MKGFSIQKECPDKIGMTVWYMYVGVKDEDWGSQDVVHFVRCLQSFYDRVPLTDGCSCCAAWLWTLICNISITTENIGFWHVVKVWYISWINWLRESAEVHCAMLLLPKCFFIFWEKTTIRLPGWCNITCWSSYMSSQSLVYKNGRLLHHSEPDTYLTSDHRKISLLRKNEWIHRFHTLHKILLYLYR